MDPNPKILTVSVGRVVRRWIWVIVAVTILALFITALPYRYAQLQTVRPDANTRVGELLPEDVEWLAEMGLSPRFHAAYFTVLEVISALPFFLVGGLIFWRKPDDRMGWIASITGLLTGALVTPYVNALQMVNPALEIPLLFLRSLGILGLILMYFIFPDGRFVPRWTRAVFFLFILLLGAALFIPAIRPPVGIASFRDSDLPNVIFFTILLGGSSLAQIYRYRYVSTPIQRQQTKWVVLGTGLAVVVLIVGVLLPAIAFPELRQPGLPALQMRFYAVTVTLFFTIPVFPVTMAIAILRYRLWDIDLIIRRTLVYSLLTGFLALVYFSGVTLLQSIFSAVSGQQSPAALVLSTLGIAALFNPLRGRVQDFIDRRFYRQKYDAEKALAEFAAAARQETDLEHLTHQLTKTVQETVQPTETSVWVRKSP
jgi:hypothetical protein